MVDQVYSWATSTTQGWDSVLWIVYPGASRDRKIAQNRDTSTSGREQSIKLLMETLENSMSLNSGVEYMTIYLYRKEKDQEGFTSQVPNPYYIPKRFLNGGGGVGANTGIGSVQQNSLSEKLLQEQISGLRNSSAEVERLRNEIFELKLEKQKLELQSQINGSGFVDVIKPHIGEIVTSLKDLFLAFASSQQATSPAVGRVGFPPLPNLPMADIATIQNAMPDGVSLADVIKQLAAIAKVDPGSFQEIIVQLSMAFHNDGTERQEATT